jgi:hypothetical protein
MRAVVSSNGVVGRCHVTEGSKGFDVVKIRSGILVIVQEGKKKSIPGQSLIHN